MDTFVSCVILRIRWKETAYNCFSICVSLLSENMFVLSKVQILSLHYEQGIESKKRSIRTIRSLPGHVAHGVSTPHMHFLLGPPSLYAFFVFSNTFSYLVVFRGRGSHIKLDLTPHYSKAVFTTSLRARPVVCKIIWEFFKSLGSYCT